MVKKLTCFGASFWAGNGQQNLAGPSQSRESHATHDRSPSATTIAEMLALWKNRNRVLWSLRPLDDGCHAKGGASHTLRFTRGSAQCSARLVMPFRAEC